MHKHLGFDDTGRLSPMVRGKKGVYGEGEMYCTTVNVNSWGSFSKVHHLLSKWDIVAVQETKLHTDGKVNAAVSELRRQGMAGACFSKACTTQAGGISAGVGICWKGYVNVVATCEVQQGRASGILVRSRVAGLVAFYSVYGFVADAGGFARASILLNRVCEHAKTWGAPFVLAGDFNAKQQRITEWAHEVGIEVRISAPCRNTCAASEGAVIDYFIVSPELEVLMPRQPLL